jgi:hypothetical protein
MLFKIIILIFLSFKANFSCPITKDEEYYVVSDFSKFSDLNFTDCSRNFKNLVGLELKPYKKLILDNTLNLTGLKLTAPGSNNFGIIFRNIKGIDYKSPGILLNQIQSENKRDIHWNFKSSNFDFYFGNQLIDKKLCNLEYFYKKINKNAEYWILGFLISDIEYLFLRSDVKLSEQTCPLVFGYLKIQLFAIEKLSSSFIYTNMLGFYENKYNKSFDSLKLMQFTARLFHVNLKQTLFNEIVFGNLLILDLYGQINSIQNDLFKYLNSLKILRIHTQNARRLLTNNNKWFEYLNFKVNLESNEFANLYKNLDKIFILSIVQTFTNLTYYNYPEEDFCYFKNFPHKQFVLTSLRPNYKTSFSCTEIYLIQYSYFLEEEIDFYLNGFSDFSYFMEKFFNKNVSNYVDLPISVLKEECDFEKRLKNCNITTIESKKYWDMIDWYETSEYTYLAFLLYVNPMFAFFCILINLINVAVLKSKYLKKEIQNNYNYFNLHSISNVIFLLLIPFELITNCVFSEFFCSEFFDSFLVHYLDKIILKLLNNSFKTFSNVSYLAFILIRYINVTNTKNKHLKRFKNIKFRNFIVITFLLSLLVNSYICFEYEFVSRDKLYSKLNDLNSVKPFDNFKTDISHKEFIILNFFQYIKLIISDLLFFLLSIMIDLTLIIFIQKNINKMRVASLGITTSVVSLELKKKSKSRLTAMVILNGINFLLLRFPLAVIDFYGLIFSYNKNNDSNLVQFKPDIFSFVICRIFLFCQDLQKIFTTLYFISFFVQFFIFFKLDKNFKQGLSFKIV